MTQPSGLMNLVRAAAGALPFVPRSDKLPDRTITVDDLAIDPANVAAYAHVTGLQFGDAVPLTYPFALTFPTVMALVTGFDFPFAAMGSVHIENHIAQHRPIAVTDTISAQVHAENLREHRKGLLVRSAEHTSELQSPDTISYAVFCLKKKKQKKKKNQHTQNILKINKIKKK